MLLKFMMLHFSYLRNRFAKFTKNGSVQGFEEMGDIFDVFDIFDRLSSTELTSIK